MRNTPGQDDVPATDRAIMRGAERILKLYRISPGCILRILSQVQSDPALRDSLVMVRRQSLVKPHRRDSAQRPGCDAYG